MATLEWMELLVIIKALCSLKDRSTNPYHKPVREINTTSVEEQPNII